MYTLRFSFTTYVMFVYYLFSKKTADVGLLLTLNEMRAQKELAFSVTRTTFKLEPLVEELRGYGISLKMALIWQIQGFFKVLYQEFLNLT